VFRIVEAKKSWHAIRFFAVVIFALCQCQAQAFAEDQQAVEAEHRALVEQLKQLDQKHNRFGLTVHTLIVPVGAVPNYDFPIPVTRVRYESVPLFGFDQSKPASDAVAIIKELSEQFASDNALVAIAVVGHTDSVGTDKYNDDLSYQRAVSVATWIQAFGVVDKKVLAIGMGKSRPIASNATEAGKALNRRVEFFLSSVPEAILPSVQGSNYAPEFRNSNLPQCADLKPGDPVPGECAGPEVERKPVVTVDKKGHTTPSGPPLILDQSKPQLHVEEIPEREAVPVPDDNRDVP